IGGSALTECADIEVPLAQLRNVPPAPEYRLHISVLPCKGDHCIEVVAHSLEPLEVARNEFLGFSVLDTKLPRESVGSLAVNGREVDGLRAAAHGPRHIVQRH